MKRLIILTVASLLILMLLVMNERSHYSKLPWPKRAYEYANVGFNTCLGRFRILSIDCFYHPSSDYYTNNLGEDEIRKIEKYCRRSTGVKTESIDSYKAEFLLTCRNDGIVMQIKIYVPREEEKNDAPWVAKVTYLVEGNPEEWRLENSKPSIW